MILLKQLCSQEDWLNGGRTSDMKIRKLISDGAFPEQFSSSPVHLCNSLQSFIEKLISLPNFLIIDLEATNERKQNISKLAISITVNLSVTSHIKNQKVWQSLTLVVNITLYIVFLPSGEHFCTGKFLMNCTM